jgi:hypothetical protein
MEPFAATGPIDAVTPLAGGMIAAASHGASLVGIDTGNCPDGGPVIACTFALSVPVAD